MNYTTTIGRSSLEGQAHVVRMIADSDGGRMIFSSRGIDGDLRRPFGALDGPDCFGAI